MKCTGLLSGVALVAILSAGCGSSGESDDDASSVGETATPAAVGDDDSSVAGTDPYLVLVGDNGSNRFKVIGPETGRLVYQLDLATYRPDICSSQMGCFIFGTDHRVIDGHDFIDVTYGQPATLGLSAFTGNIDRVQLTNPPTLRWRLNNLDFSGLPGGASAYCGADASDPCKPDKSADSAAQALCRIGDAHDFEVLSDDPVAQRAELMVADTDYYRLMKVELDYANGNTCGRVVSTLDSTRNPDWAKYAEPNNLVHVAQESHEYYLVTQRSIEQTEGMISGYGVLQLWELEPDNSWSLHWTFPEQGGAVRQTLNYPHGGEYLPGGHPEGALFRFGDAASLSTTETSGGPGYPGGMPTSSGGSVGVLLIRDLLEPPDYLYDLYQPPSDGVWGFPRFAEEVGDGTVLVTDSGCIGGLCSVTPRLIWVNAKDYGNSDKAGYWTTDYAQLELVSQTGNLPRQLSCGLVSPFSSQIIHSDDIGAELASAQAAGGDVCP